MGIGGFFISKNGSQPEEIIGPEGEIETGIGAEINQEEEMGKEVAEEVQAGTPPEELPEEEIPQNIELSPTEEVQDTPETPPVLELLSWQKESGIKAAGAVSSCTIFKDNQYWLYYTGIGGIFLARAADGLNFQEYGMVVNNGDFGSEQETVTNPAVFRLKNGQYRMIYEGAKNQQTIRKLYSAISSDGLEWTKEAGVRLEDSIFFYDPKKGTGSDVVFTSVPDVIELENGCFRMYYTVIDESRIAESCDEGLSWQKKGKIMFDVYPEVTQDPDIIQLDNGKYKLFFSTQNFERTRQWILSASSEDGINFKIDSGKRIEPALGKTRAVDPDVVKLPDGTYRMYYGESFTFSGDFDIFSAISKD